MSKKIGVQLYAEKINFIGEFTNILDIDTKSVKCFLCHYSFTNGDESFLLFNKRIQTDGNSECTLAKILSLALGIEIEQSTAHSLLLCTNCNEIVLAFEHLEQQLAELRSRIVNAYTTTTIELQKLTEDGTKLVKSVVDTGQQEYDNLIEEWAIEEDENSLNAIQNVDVEADDLSNNEIIENNNSVADEMSLQEINEQDVIIFDGSFDSNSLNIQNEFEKPNSGKEDSMSDFTLPNDSVESESVSLKVTQGLKSNENKKQFEFIKVENEILATQIFNCDLCDETFYTEDLLNLHFTEVHVNEWNSLLHECEICKVYFENYADLEIHMSTHEEREKLYVCEQCKKTFASKYSLQTHIKTHGERPRSFECDKCEKRFLTQQNLQHHKKIHNNQRLFKCKVCEKGFTTQHNLDAHGIVHTGKRPYACGICGKSFARRAEVTDHERIHTGLKPFKCDLCDAAFAQRSNLTAHKKTTHLNEKLHKCDICERSFKRRRLLEYHKQAAHTGERPYKCKICSSSFVYPEHFKKHQRIHTGDKPFSCEVCGKSFNSRDNRNAHRFVHSDKKPYECMQCGMGFMRKPLLLAHMKHLKHVNDTIIVNQPQINGGILQTTTLTLQTENVDNENRELIVPDSCVNAKSIGFKIEPNNDYNSNVEKIEARVNQSEIDHIKYIQFEDLEVDLPEDEN